MAVNLYAATKGSLQPNDVHFFYLLLGVRGGAKEERGGGVRTDEYYTETYPNESHK